MRQLQDKEIPRELAPEDTLPEELLSLAPPTEVHLEKNLLLQTLRSLRRGLSGGLSGMRNEHLKAFLPDTEALDYLAQAAHLFVNAHVATEVLDSFRLARWTAL